MICGVAHLREAEGERRGYNLATLSENLCFASNLLCEGTMCKAMLSSQTHSIQAQKIPLNWDFFSFSL